MGTDTYSKVSISGASNYTSDPHEMPLQSSIPPLPLSMGASEQPSSARGQYTYMQQPASGSQLPASTSTPAVASHADSALSVPRYVDNGRPNKSPRQSGQQSVHGGNSISSSESPEYRYGSSTQGSASSREYYPPSQAWSTTTAGESTSSTAYASTDPRPYPFPHEPYKPGAAAGSSVKTESRASFEPMHNYSWHGN